MYEVSLFCPFRPFHPFDPFLSSPFTSLPLSLSLKGGVKRGGGGGVRAGARYSLKGNRKRKGSLTSGRALTNPKRRNRERSLQDGHLHLNLPRTAWRGVTSGLSLSRMLQSAPDSLHIIRGLDGG